MKRVLEMKFKFFPFELDSRPVTSELLSLPRMTLFDYVSQVKDGEIYFALLPKSLLRSN